MIKVRFESEVHHCVQSAAFERIPEIPDGRHVLAESIGEFPSGIQIFPFEDVKE